MHTGLPGFKHRKNRPELRVEYIHMGALLGYVVDIVIGAMMGMDDAVVDMVTKTRVLKALNKVVWIQNDLFARHYLPNLGEQATVAAPVEGEEAKTGGSCLFSGHAWESKDCVVHLYAEKYVSVCIAWYPSHNTR